MTLFAGDGIPFTPASPSRRRSGRFGRALLVLTLVGLVLFALLPSPYVIERPGPVFDTLGTVSINGKQTQMIEIPEQKTWPTKGALDLLTVSMVGDRDNLPNWLEVVGAWLDPSQAVLPLDAVYPPGYTVEDSNKQGEVAMQNSQKNAVAAALRSLGHDVPSTVVIADVMEKSPSSGIIRAGDTITSVDGSPIDSVEGLRDAIAAGGAGNPLRIGVLRDGEKEQLTVTPEEGSEGDSGPIIGVYAGVHFDFPFDVTIQLENVGGPSAGQMFALGVIDKLTPGSLTGGKHVAGTGTIDGDGTIGRIGGIREKMYGAQRAGATYFLAPRGDCDEVVGHVPDGLTVIAVKTLEDSLHGLSVISSGGDASALPSCTSG